MVAKRKRLTKAEKALHEKLDDIDYEMSHIHESIITRRQKAKVKGQVADHTTPAEKKRFKALLDNRTALMKKLK